MSGTAAALMGQTLGFRRVGITVTFSSEASASAPPDGVPQGTKVTPGSGGGGFPSHATDGRATPICEIW